MKAQQLVDTEIRRLSEDERVLLWRAEELERVGYSPAAASALAASREVDLHVALKLPRNGCCHNTALRILL
jgi:hypothetical protein